MAKQKAEETPVEPVVKMPHVGTAVLNIVREMATNGIGKDRKNEQQNFKFRGIDDMLNALAPLFAREKILVLPSYANRQSVEYQAKSGGRLTNVTIEGSYKLVSLVDGSELLSGPFVGEGMDSGDKATNKAMSIAYKYFAIQTFAIPVVGSDDPDFESHEPEPKTKGRTAAARAPVAEKQQPPENETLEQAINRLASSKDARRKLAAVVCGAYDVVLIDNLPEDKVPEAIKRLEAYVEKAKK